MLYFHSTLFLIQFKAEDEDIQGGIELDGDDLLFNQAIEEFIQVRYIVHHGHMNAYCHLLSSGFSCESSRYDWKDEKKI